MGGERSAELVRTYAARNVKTYTISTFTRNISSIASVKNALLCGRIRWTKLNDEQSDPIKLENGASIVHRNRTFMRRDLLEFNIQGSAEGQQERGLTIENIRVRASERAGAEY